LGRRTGTGLPGTGLFGYLTVEVVGGIGGAGLANLMFDLPAVQIANTVRATSGLWLG
jgi:hypothetical protein